MTAINSNRAIRGPVTAVPVVAGKGVRLVADTENNRWVVEADETILWSGSTVANVNETVTLSETPSNFEYLQIYVTRFGYGSAICNVTPDSAGNISCFLAGVNGGTTQLNCYAFSGTFNNKVLTITGKTTKLFDSTNYSTNTSSPLTITKIVGINRIASN